MDLQDILPMDNFIRLLTLFFINILLGIKYINSPECKRHSDPKINKTI